ncbi:beta-microseminoprotein-like [Diretmus argenteus]
MSIVYKTSLQVLVCLLGLVVLCQSQCFFQELVMKDLNNPPKGCVDKDGKQHAFDSEWVKDCYDCSCSTQGMSCCNKIPSAVDIPEECEMVVNKETCSAELVLKADKTKACSPV